jgi:hypothetical protein
MNRLFAFVRFAGVAIAVLLGAVTANAAITGSISGVVTDPSGAVVPGVTVVATSVSTNVQSKVVTDSKGFYRFPTLNVDTYNVSANQAGFRDYLQSGVKIDANSALRIDISMELGAVTNTVSVKSDALQVETQSTQNGVVIQDTKITSVPLNGRSYIDLLKLQPGVSPYSHSQDSSTSGIGATQVSGDLDNGQQSVNGGRSGSKRIYGEWGKRRRRRAQRRRHDPQSRLHRAVPHHHQQLRCGVRKLQRRTGQCSHEVGNQPVSRNSIRLPAQHRS